MKLTKKKKIALIFGGASLVVLGGVLCYMYGHKPNKVNNPCWCTFHRSDGVAKKAFNTAAEANKQTIKQLIFHGEICNSYEANGKFYTGHSKNAPFKSINPFKTTQKSA